MVSMFRNEWIFAGNARPLRSIAIADKNPEQQYLHRPTDFYLCSLGSAVHREASERSCRRQVLRPRQINLMPPKTSLRHYATLSYGQFSVLSRYWLAAAYGRRILQPMKDHR